MLAAAKNSDSFVKLLFSHQDMQELHGSIFNACGQRVPKIREALTNAHLLGRTHDSSHVPIFSYKLFTSQVTIP
jgi:hypothetical protein